MKAQNTISLLYFLGLAWSEKFNFNYRIDTPSSLLKNPKPKWSGLCQSVHSQFVIIPLPICLVTTITEWFVWFFFLFSCFWNCKASEEKINCHQYWNWEENVGKTITIYQVEKHFLDPGKSSFVHEGAFSWRFLQSGISELFLGFDFWDST